MGKATKYKGVLPKRAKIGTVVTKEVKVRGNKRKMTWKRIRQKKNSNLKWKITSNKEA